MKSKLIRDSEALSDRINREKNIAMTTDNNLKDIKLTTAQLNKLKVKRQFEIIIEEANWDRCDQNGNPEWRRVNMGHEAGKPVIISVSSAKELNELQMQYQAADQRFKITREVDPPTNEQLVKMAIEQGIVKLEDIDHSNDVETTAEVKPVEKPKVVDTKHFEAQKLETKPIVKPKIVTVGDIQLKYDGDKVYQKQWIRLSANEAANIRVVNDANNKLVSLNGKHFEARKWVLIEETSDTEDNNAEELLNG